METIWGHAPQVPLGGNPNPGMWMYGDTLARLRRLAPGVLYNDLKACNDYQMSGEVQLPGAVRPRQARRDDAAEGRRRAAEEDRAIRKACWSTCRAIP